MNDDAYAGRLDDVENSTKVVTSVELGRHAGDQRASGPGASEDEPAAKLVDALLRQVAREVPRTGTSSRRTPRRSLVFASTELHEVLEVTGPRANRWSRAGVGRRRYVDAGAVTAVTRGNAEASDLGLESESDVAHALMRYRMKVGIDPDEMVRRVELSGRRSAKRGSGLTTARSRWVTLRLCCTTSAMTIVPEKRVNRGQGPKNVCPDGVQRGRGV